MSFYLRLTVILTSHFSNITYFRQQQQQNKPMKYYEILPTHTETPRNATRKIANLYIEFNYHFLTLQKKIPLLLNRSVPMFTQKMKLSCAKWEPFYMPPCVNMMTSSNGNIFRVTGPLCGNSPVTGEFPSQRPVARGFDVFFYLRLNKWLSKQSWGWGFETPSGSLWRHCNESAHFPLTGTSPIMTFDHTSHRLWGALPVTDKITWNHTTSRENSADILNDVWSGKMEGKSLIPKWNYTGNMSN